MKLNKKEYFILVGFFIEWFFFYISGYLRVSSLFWSIILSVAGIFWAAYVGKLIKENSIDNYKLKQEVKNGVQGKSEETTEAGG